MVTVTTTRCVPATPLVWMLCAQSPTLHGVNVVGRTITSDSTARLASTPSPTPSVHVQSISVSLCTITRSARRERYNGVSTPASCVMYVVLDQITHRYAGVTSPALPEYRSLSGRERSRPWSDCPARASPHCSGSLPRTATTC